MTRKTKRIKKKKRRRTIRRIARRAGGNAIDLSILYGDTTIKNGQDLTGQSRIYKQVPTIKINPADDKTYLITMTDPDAPSYKQGKHTWTHYVALIKGDGMVKKELYTYQPPSPPPNSGIHHYNFNVYSFDDYAQLKNNTNLTGNLYYQHVLEPLIKNKKSIAMVSYIVRASTL
jgi:phosphatidylethanolamine-binding protein (PEBP) family uncharacterized protein